MGSKIFLFLGLLFAIVLFISSEVAARDLAETSTEKTQVEVTDVKKGNNGVVNDAKYPGGGGYGGYPGGGYGGYPGGGYGGRSGYGGRGGYGGGGHGGYGRGGGGGGRGRCYYGCCRSNYYGRGCDRCCNYAGEAVDKQPQVKPHN